MENKIHDFIRQNVFDEPTLVLDEEQVEQNFLEFTSGFAGVHTHYAVKANPQPRILKRLVSMGCKFDAASIQEIYHCRQAGALSKDISFGNTVKHLSAIKTASFLGIDLFAADSHEELEKIAKGAPGTKVYLRLLVRSTEAEWPLSRKFGCSSSMIHELLDYGKLLGLRMVGLSFHVGSQTRHPHMWLDTLDYVASTWSLAREAGHDLWLLNIGGGFPSYYGIDVTPMQEYGKLLLAEVYSRFEGVTYLMAEPGRSIAASLGSIAAEVLLVSHKTAGDPIRWVYLNIGRFGGLAETEAEAIKYRFFIPDKDHEPKSECIMAGPTCDSADVMYEIHKVMLPESLQCGDKVIIDNTGAYTMTYSSVGFNGFSPLRVMLI